MDDTTADIAALKKTIKEIEHHQAELLDMLGSASRDIKWLLNTIYNMRMDLGYDEDTGELLPQNMPVSEAIMEIRKQINGGDSRPLSDLDNYDARLSPAALTDDEVLRKKLNKE